MAKRYMPTTLRHSCSLGVFLLGVTFVADGVEHHGSLVDADAGYKECLTCHDGLAAPDIFPCLGPICTFRDSHPVDVPYPPPDKLRDYAPAAVAEMAGVKLINGRIDCISCHDLHNPGPLHLRISDRYSRLCLACHLK